MIEGLGVLNVNSTSNAGAITSADINLGLGSSPPRLLYYYCMSIYDFSLSKYNILKLFNAYKLENIKASDQGEVCSLLCVSTVVEHRGSSHGTSQTVK